MEKRREKGTTAIALDIDETCQVFPTEIET